jgi:hypothetical protein
VKPDPKAVVINYLKGLPEIVGAPLSARVEGKTPSSRGLPWVKVTTIDDSGTDGGITDHHIAAFLQLDCYAGTTNNSEARASLLSRTVQEALRVMATSPHTGAVVTGARSSGSHEPDTVLGESALERYIVQSTVWMRSE